MTPAARAVIATGGGAAAFLLLAGLTSWAAPVTLAIGAAVGVALRLVLPARARVRSSAEQRAAIRGLEDHADALDKASRGIREISVRADVRGIATVLREIAEKLGEDARDLLAAEELLRDYLPRTVALVERMASIAERPHADTGREERLAAAGHTLSRVRRDLQEHYRRTLEQELVDLSVDRRVFEELLLVGDDAALADAGAERRREAE